MVISSTGHNTTTTTGPAQFLPYTPACVCYHVMGTRLEIAFFYSLDSRLKSAAVQGTDT